MGSKLRAPYEGFPSGEAEAGSLQHPICHRYEVESLIKAVTKGAQITVAVFFKAQKVEGAAKTCFYIAQYRVDPAKLRQLVRMTTSYDYRLMVATNFCYGAQAGSSIR